MIELNLLPDVKLEFIKAQRSRRMVLVIALLVSAASIALLVLMLAANGIQKKHINDLSTDIDATTKKLKNESQIGRILTVQNQLESLTSLHASKPASSRLFDYLNQLTPAQVAISNLTMDYTLQTATITGSADAISSINKYVDTLKFTTYSEGNSDDEAPAKTKAFNNVVLSAFGFSSDASNGKPASYTITLAYDKNIFDITKDIKLDVPSLTTTRSGVDNPSDLFQSSGSASPNQGGR